MSDGRESPFFGFIVAGLVSLPVWAALVWAIARYA